jgi:hypothetical protein
MGEHQTFREPYRFLMLRQASLIGHYCLSGGGWFRRIQATDALKGVAHYVITRLQSQGYQSINGALQRR